ncbi:transporter [Clostridia bacterium]|nr:transporter [Clostridia bacterium]
MNIQVPENPVEQNRIGDFTPLVVIAALMVCSYLTANIMAVKLIGAWDVALIDAGTITFPLSYILGDVLAEVWGFRVARKVILLTFVCNIIFTVATAIGVIIPSPEYLAGTADAYNMIFTYVPRIVAASLVAFLAGEITNAYFLVKIRALTKGRFLWMRTIGSSAVGYILDTVIFCVVAFAGTVRLSDMFIMIVVQYIIKILIEAICGTPICYAVTGALRRHYIGALNHE